MYRKLTPHIFVTNGILRRYHFVGFYPLYYILSLPKYNVLKDEYWLKVPDRC